MNLQSVDERLRTGWPTIEDLNAGNVYRSPRVDDVRVCLDSKRFALLFAPEGRGKSTLARYLAFEARSQERIWFVGCAEPATQTLAELALSIRNSDCKANRPLWIIDDVHLAAQELQDISDTFDQATHSRFLFVARYGNDWPVGDLVEPAEAIELQVAEEAIREIIDLYISTRALQPRFVQSSGLSDADYAAAVSLCGGNLRALKLVLDEWDPRDGSLAGLSAASVARTVAKRVLQPLAEAHGVAVVDTFASISTFSKWGIGLPIAGLDPMAVQKLVSLGYVTRLDDSPAIVKSPHAADGLFYERAYAYWKGVRIDDVDRECARRVLQLFRTKALLYAALKTLSSERHRLLDYATAEQVLDRLGKSIDRRTIRGASDLARVTVDPRIARRIVESFGGASAVTDALKKTANDDVRTLLSALRHHDDGLASELQAGMTLNDRIQQYAHDRLRQVSKALQFYYDAGSLHFAKLLLAKVVEQSLATKIPRSGLQPCSRFMNAANHLDRSLAGQAAQLFAQHARLDSRPDSGQLSRLLVEFRHHPAAGRLLIDRIRESCTPSDLLDPEAPSGYGHLLSVLATDAHGRGQIPAVAAFFDAWESAVTPTMIRRMTGESVMHLLRSYAIAGRSASRWGVPATTELAEHLRQATGHVRFFLSWQIWQNMNHGFAGVIDQLLDEVGSVPIDATGLADYAFDGLLIARGYATALAGGLSLKALADEAKQGWPKPGVLWLMALYSILRRFPAGDVVAGFPLHIDYLETAIANGQDPACRRPERAGAREMARVAEAIRLDIQ